jgi:hypothetical protein
MSVAGRNEPCSCGSARKFKRCCGPLLDDPARVAKEHSAVGGRVHAWAFETYPEEMKARLKEVLAGSKEFVVGDADAQLAGTWVLSDILKSRLAELEVLDQPDGLAVAMHAASREIVQLFLPALRNHPTVQEAA